MLYYTKSTKKEVMCLIGENLKNIRKQRGYTQQEMAQHLQIKRQTYSAYERDISIPDAITLDKLASFLQVSTDQILGRANINVPNNFDNTLFAFYEGDIHDLNQDEIDKISEYIKFIKSQRS